MKLEKQLEAEHRRWLESTGCESWKLWPMGRVGLPDRIIIGPNRIIYFVEWKRPGEKARKIQDYVHDRIKGYGFNVYVCTSIEEAKEVHRKESAYSAMCYF